MHTEPKTRDHNNTNHTDIPKTPITLFSITEYKCVTPTIRNVYLQESVNMCIRESTYVCFFLFSSSFHLYVRFSRFSVPPRCSSSPFVIVDYRRQPPTPPAPKDTNTYDTTHNTTEAQATASYDVVKTCGGCFHPSADNWPTIFYTPSTQMGSVVRAQFVRADVVDCDAHNYIVHIAKHSHTAHGKYEKKKKQYNIFIYKSRSHLNTHTHLQIQTNTNTSYKISNISYLNIACLN